MNRISLAWLGMAAVALCLVIAGEILGGGLSGPAQNVAPRGYSGSRATNAAQPPEGAERRWVAAILVRPLFDPSRRTAGMAVAPTGALRLSGVIVGPLGRQAIFEPVAGGKPVVVREGERVGNDLVRSIGPDRVLIEGNDGLRALRPTYAVPVGGTR